MLAPPSRFGATQVSPIVVDVISEVASDNGAEGTTGGVVMLSGADSAENPTALLAATVMI